MRFKEFCDHWQQLLTEEGDQPVKAFLSSVEAEMKKDNPYDGSDQHLAAAAKLLAGLQLVGAAALAKPDGPDAQLFAKAMVGIKPGVEGQPEEIRDALYKKAAGTPAVKNTFQRLKNKDADYVAELMKTLRTMLPKLQLKIKVKAAPAGKEQPAAAA